MLAAMAPCARLYAYLGCQLAAARPGTTHKYTRWAATYSGAQYRGWVARKERLLDRCGRGVPHGEPTPLTCALSWLTAHSTWTGSGICGQTAGTVTIMGHYGRGVKAT